MEIAEDNLTELSEVLYHLLQNDGIGVNMKGTIRTKESCPKCAKPFSHIRKIGYICQSCKTTPKRFYIDIHYQGKRLRIYSNKQGIPFDSYQLSAATLSIINEEIRNHKFDPTNYVKSEIKRFFISNLLTEYYHKKLSFIAPSYLPTFTKHIKTAKEFFSTIDIREFRKIDIEKYKDYLNTLKIGQKTIKNYLDTLKAFLNWCRNILEIISTVPAFPQIEIPKPKIQWVDTETQALIYHATPEQDKPIMLFLMLTGCRPAEARALRVKHIDLKRGVITVGETFSRNVLRPKRKGKNAPNVFIPIHPELMTTLRECIQGKLPDAFVFVNSRTGNPYSQDSIGRLWNSIKKKLNLPLSLRLYDATRHSLASNLINQGATLSDVSKILGHTNISTTTRYAHMDISRAKCVIQNISIFDKKINKQVVK
jgi:integrase